MVRTTSAATSITTAVTTIRMVVERAFIRIYWQKLLICDYLQSITLLVHVHDLGLNTSAQLCTGPPATLTLGELHVTGMAPVEHVIWALLMHRLWACVIVATFCMPPPKIVKITSAATRTTTAVTTIMMVVASPFILKLWCRSFKNLLGFVHQLIEAEP
jgi:hypothetical protein